MAAAVQNGYQRSHARIQRAAAGRLHVEEPLAATIRQASARGTALTWFVHPNTSTIPRSSPRCEKR